MQRQNKFFTTPAILLAAKKLIVLANEPYTDLLGRRDLAGRSLRLNAKWRTLDRQALATTVAQEKTLNSVSPDVAQRMLEE